MSILFLDDCAYRSTTGQVHILIKTLFFIIKLVVQASIISSSFYFSDGVDFIPLVSISFKCYCLSISYDNQVFKFLQKYASLSPITPRTSAVQ